MKRKASLRKTLFGVGASFYLALQTFMLANPMLASTKSKQRIIPKAVDLFETVKLNYTETNKVSIPEKSICSRDYELTISGRDNIKYFISAQDNNSSGEDCRKGVADEKDRIYIRVIGPSGKRIAEFYDNGFNGPSNWEEDMEFVRLSGKNLISATKYKEKEV